MKILFIVLILLFAQNSYARGYDKEVIRKNIKTVQESNEWTKLNTKLELTHIGLSLIDWRQSRHAMKHQDLYEESNPLLRENVSPETIDAWFAGYTFIHYGISYLLPRDWREVWQGITIIRKAGNVYHNYQIGLKFGF